MEYTEDFVRHAATAAGIVDPTVVEKLVQDVKAAPSQHKTDFDKFFAAALAAAGLTKLTGQPDTTS